MCPNTEYFLVRISRHSDCISPCSVRMRGNTDQKILRIWALFTLYSFSLFQKTQNSEFNFRPTEFFNPHVSSSCWQRTGSLFLRKKNIAMLTIQTMNQMLPMPSLFWFVLVKSKDFVFVLGKRLDNRHGANEESK